MGRRKCTPKQLAALKRGREKAHRRSKKNTKGLFSSIGKALKPPSMSGAVRTSGPIRIPIKIPPPGSSGWVSIHN